MLINPLSYPGNKNKLLKEIIPNFPEQINEFVDVFCGSGVVGLNSGANKIIYNDIDKHCTDILKYLSEHNFKTIISDIEDIIDKYKLTYSHRDGKTYVEKNHEGLSIINKKSFNKLKADYNKDKDIIKLIVLSIYGFNHYIRFNSKGDFNIPVGKVDLSTSIYNNLESFIDGLKNKVIKFCNYDFRNDKLYSNINAIYYFDPPYLITQAPYNSFWDEDDEKDLLKLLDTLNERGIKFCLSNVFLSNGKENTILKNWALKYTIVKLNRQYRNANYQKTNITDSIEVLIKNY